MPCFINLESGPNTKRCTMNIYYYGAAHNTVKPKGRHLCEQPPLIRFKNLLGGKQHSDSPSKEKQNPVFLPASKRRAGSQASMFLPGRAMEGKVPQKGWPVEAERGSWCVASGEELASLCALPVDWLIWGAPEAGAVSRPLHLAPARPVQMCSGHGGCEGRGWVWTQPAAQEGELTWF